MNSDFVLLEKEQDLAEKTVCNLKQQLLTLKNSLENKGVELNDDEIAALVLENKKLKHRLAILNRSINKYQPQSNEIHKTLEDMTSVQEILEFVFADAIKTAFPAIPNPPIVISLSGNNPKFGDYQCNSAMAIANLLKQQGIKTSPKNVGDSIMNNVKPHELIDRLEVAGPGFINIYLSKSFVIKNLMMVLKNGPKPPKIQDYKKVIVDFSSPNIAKEMHVGHLRSTIIGDSFARLLEFLGVPVLRINHVGDWGTQFGMLIAHLKDVCPDFLSKPVPIADLQAFYKEAKTHFDSDPEFKKRAYTSVVALQSFQPEYIKAWNIICDISRKEFQKIYDRLNIKLIERGESFYQKRMEKIVEDLKNRGLLEEDEGRLILWGSDDVKIPLTVVKSDGGFTYDTSDLATLEQRLEEEKSDWILYVTDAGQATHFSAIFSCCKKIGILKDHHRVDHIGFGVVLGEDKKKFKTRSGDTVRLVELLDEGLKRSLEKLKLKGRDKVLTAEELKKAQEAVAYGCIKYADLAHNYNHEYIFSFDKMLEDKGNTAVYLLYAHSRIRSIARNANLTAEDIKQLAEKYEITLDHEKEWKLGKVLIKFTDVLLKITKDLYLHCLCEYVYEVATTFSEFYDNCYCIEKDSAGNVIKMNYGRILLAEITAITIKTCLEILGLNVVDKM